MTYALYVIILVSSPFVVFVLLNEGCKWWSAFGDARWARAAALRAEPEVSGIASIAIAGEAL